MSDPQNTHRVMRFEAGRVGQHDDHLATEEPLEIRVRGRAISVTMRTPGNDDELAVGFLLTEGVIREKADVERVEPCERDDKGNVVNVVLAAHVVVNFDRLTRHVFGSSSCGLCGKATIESIQAQFPPVESNATIDASVLLGLPEMMRRSQADFDRTGGLHAAAIFDPLGNLLIAREDVGRHNAVDKVIGWVLLNDRFPLDTHTLLVSGRASFEIMQKSLAARIPIVAAVSAPSSLAVDFGERSNQTLIGFLRGERFNAYTHPDRVVTPTRL